MNFFDYVKLIQLGHFPFPPHGDWTEIRSALVNLEKVARAAHLDGPGDEAPRLAEYIKRMDAKYDYKEVSDERPVE